MTKVKRARITPMQLSTDILGNVFDYLPRQLVHGAARAFCIRVDYRMYKAMELHFISDYVAKTLDTYNLVGNMLAMNYFVEEETFDELVLDKYAGELSDVDYDVADYKEGKWVYACEVIY